MKRNTGLNRLTLLKSKSIKKIRPCTRTTKSQIFVAKSQVNIYNKKPKVENDDETSISKWSKISLQVYGLQKGSVFSEDFLPYI